MQCMRSIASRIMVRWPCIDHKLVDLWLGSEGDTTFGELGEEAQEAMLFCPYVHETMNCVSIIIGKQGHMGLAPPGVQEGDLIAAVRGAVHPRVLRKQLPRDATSL